MLFDDYGVAVYSFTQLPRFSFFRLYVRWFYSLFEHVILLLMLTIPQKKSSFGRRASLIVTPLLLLGGIYVGLTAASPLWLTASSLDPNGDVGKKVTSHQPNDTQNRLYIPKLNVDVPYQANQDTALENGAWWRSPESGNPKDGGNFVVAAHRFQMGWTPRETTRKSPFYSIDKLAVGDQIVADHDGERYIYEIEKIHRIAPDAAHIEAPTDDNRLTLYSCTRGGASDGRDVVIARLQSQDETL